MIQKHSKHLPHYLPLIGIFVISIIGFLTFRYDPGFQRAVAASTAIAYVTWGVVHHIIHKDFNLIVLLEYVGISFIGLIIILTLIP